MRCRLFGVRRDILIGSPIHLLCVVLALQTLCSVYLKNPWISSLREFWTPNGSGDIDVTYRDGYCVREFAYRGRLRDYNRVALILHASADFLNDDLMLQVENWNAPVSLTVFLDEFTADCVHRYFAHLYARSDKVARFLNVHYLYERDGGCNLNVHYAEEFYEELPSNCHVSTKMNSVKKMRRYPANIARNVARQAYSSKYILIADYDHLFSEGFERRMRELAGKEITRNPRLALVYRLFEIDHSVDTLPRTKADLRVLVEQGKAVTFHELFYWGNNTHEIEGRQEWLERPEDMAVTTIDRVLEYTNPKWEPQFVSSASIPLHDESIPYRYRDNTVLRWEMCRANYTFALANDLYMFHRGIKRKSGRTGKLGRMVNKLNYPTFLYAYQKFLKRMDVWYPTTADKCPRWTGDS